MTEGQTIYQSTVQPPLHLPFYSCDEIDPTLASNYPTYDRNFPRWYRIGPSFPRFQFQSFRHSRKYERMDERIWWKGELLYRLTWALRRNGKKYFCYPWKVDDWKQKTLTNMIQNFDLPCHRDRQLYKTNHNHQELQDFLHQVQPLTPLCKQNCVSRIEVKQYQWLLYIYCLSRTWHDSIGNNFVAADAAHVAAALGDIISITLKLYGQRKLKTRLCLYCSSPGFQIGSSIFPGSSNDVDVDSDFAENFRPDLH